MKESELHKIIYKNLQTKEGKSSLIKRGLDLGYCTAAWHSEVSMGPYGRADIVGINFQEGSEDWQAYILELKINPLNINDFIQLSRYMRCMEHIHNTDKLSVCGTLITKKIDSMELFLLSYLYKIDVYFWDYGIDGLFFERASKSLFLNLTSEEKANIKKIHRPLIKNASENRKKLWLEKGEDDNG